MADPTPTRENVEAMLARSLPPVDGELRTAPTPQEVVALCRSWLAMEAEVAALKAALAEAAVPLEALRATECDEAAMLLAPQVKTCIVEATETIRAVLLGPACGGAGRVEPGRGRDGR